MKKLCTLLGLFLLTYSAQAQRFVPTTPQAKGIMLEEFTGCSCVTCPNGHKAANDVARNYPDRFHIINVHYGSVTRYLGLSAYTTSIGGTLEYRLGPVASYPQGAINRKLSTDNIYIIPPRNWNYYVAQESHSTTPVNIAARCSIDIDTRNLKLHVQTYYTQDGIGTKDYLNIAILQNNIVGIQSNGSSNPEQYLGEGKYMHQHMLRTHLTPNDGLAISPVVQGSFHENFFTHIIPDKYGNSSGVYGMIDAVLEDLEILAYVTDSFYNVQQVVKAEVVFTSNKPNRVLFQPAHIVEEQSYSCTNITHLEAKFKNIGNNEVRKIRGYYTNNNGLPNYFQYEFDTPISPDALATFPLNYIQTDEAQNIISISINEVNDIRIPPITQNIVVAKALNVVSNVLQADIDFTYDFIGDNVQWSLRDLTSGLLVHTQLGSRNFASQTIRTTLPLIDGHCYEFTMQDDDGEGFFASTTAGATIHIGTEEILSYEDNNYFMDFYSFKFILNGERMIAVQNTPLTQAAQVYPNPNQGWLNLKLEMAEAQALHIEIINALGQVLHQENNYQSSAGANNLQLNVSHLANGLYFVRLSNMKGQEILPFVLNK